MYVITDGYAYLVSDDTGYKIGFDVDGNMTVDTTSTISITTQEQYTYEEMFKKMNFNKAIQEARVTYISTNASADDIAYLVNRVYDAFDGDEDLSKKMEGIVVDTVTKIENFLDDCVISFDKNGGTGTMADVRKEVGDKYKLPTCKFTAPSNKRFKEWKIGDVSYDVGDEITISTNITVKAIWENIPQYTLTFDNNGGTGTMDSVTKYEGETYELPECTFTAPEGKEFSKWLIGEDEYDEGDEITVTANATIKATYVDTTPSQEGTE